MVGGENHSLLWFKVSKDEARREEGIVDIPKSDGSVLAPEEFQVVLGLGEEILAVAGLVENVLVLWGSLSGVVEDLDDTLQVVLEGGEIVLFLDNHDAVRAQVGNGLGGLLLLGLGGLGGSVLVDREGVIDSLETLDEGLDEGLGLVAGRHDLVVGGHDLVVGEHDLWQEGQQPDLEGL